MNILGIHGGITLSQHDAAAALIVDGSLVCCIEEERLNRVKNPMGVLPVQSIRACLKEGNLSINDIDLIITPGETYNDIIPRTKEWITHQFGYSPNIKAMNHQTAHIASSFFQSGFDEAMCLSYDAWGDSLSGASAGWFNGQLSDLRLYNAELSSTDVKQIYDKPNNPTDSGTKCIPFCKNTVL